MKHLAIALAVVASTGPGRAEDKVQLELGPLADEVVKVLDKQEQKAIAIGPFVGKGKVPSNFEPEIKRILHVEFVKRKITIDADALVMISGSYAPATEDPENPSSKELYVRINATLENTKTAMPLPNVNLTSRALFGTEELGRVFAVPVALPPDGNRAVRNEAYRDALTAPAAAQDGAKVRAKTGSPFALEVLVVGAATDADPDAGRKPEKRDGLPFVEINKNEVYRLRVHNDAPHDVAVRVSIDGLDQYAFSDREFCNGDGRPRFQYMIVPKKSSAVIRGWFRTLDRADSFEVTSYAKSAAAELRAGAAPIGVICVQFHAAWADDSDKPRDETSRDAGTGRGAPVDTNLKLVKRQIGVLREQIAIRYAKPKA